MKQRRRTTSNTLVPTTGRDDTLVPNAVRNNEKHLRLTAGNKEYDIGFWDPNTQTWMLNDELGWTLLDLLKTLEWGDPNHGDIPDMEITLK